MKKSRFTEDQVLAILKEQDGGSKVADMCRKHGITDATFHNWKNKYSGMTSQELSRLRSLEQENSRLKHAVADLTVNPS